MATIQRLADYQGNAAIGIAIGEFPVSVLFRKLRVMVFKMGHRPSDRILTRVNVTLRNCYGTVSSNPSKRPSVDPRYAEPSQKRVPQIVNETDRWSGLSGNGQQSILKESGVIKDQASRLVRSCSLELASGMNYSPS